MTAPKQIRPQPGMQEEALSSTADICICGGAAGSGKSWVSVVNPLRAVHVPGFAGIIFRRTTRQLKGAGSVWELAEQIYPELGGEPRYRDMEWVFPSGATIAFAHMEHVRNRLDHQSKAYAYICFEELTHFEAEQFWYLWSRNRTTSGVDPWMFGTCNPDPDSFVRDLVDWWLDDEGFPDWNKAGQLRWFRRVDGQLVWDVPPEHPDAISMAFVPGRLDENKILMEADPKYRRRLQNLPRAEQQRLLHGNWNVREGESMFQHADITFVDPSQVPQGLRKLRAWDRAASRKSDRADADATAGVLGAVGADPSGREVLWILDAVTQHGNPADTERLIRSTAEMDGPEVPIYLEQTPGSAGKEAHYYYKTRVLPEFTVMSDFPGRTKVERAKPWCALAEQGRVMVARGSWNRALLEAMRNFPEGERDLIDAVSLVYHASITHEWPSAGGVISQKPTKSSEISKFF